LDALVAVGFGAFVAVGFGAFVAVGFGAFVAVGCDFVLPVVFTGGMGAAVFGLLDVGSDGTDSISSELLLSASCDRLIDSRSITLRT
jgi:hypothetical protein